MPTVLIVDDNEADRHLVGAILADDPAIDVQYAVDGEAGLAQIKAAPPDAVVTDMMMPKVDGLELVITLHDRHPSIPVILMTSQGNEKLAADALSAGAASYVPKHMLRQELSDTLHHMLALSLQKRGRTRLMAALRRATVTFCLPNESEVLTALVSHLQENVAQLGICDQAEQIRFGVAVEEALCNAMYHGNLEVHSGLKEQDSDAFDQLVQQRRDQPPYSQRLIRVRAELRPETAVVVIEDEGPGFDPDSLPDPTSLENLDRITGRGLLLMRTFMDRIEFNAKGNCVTLTKCRCGAG